MNAEIVEKLQKSEAYLSFKAERRVQKITEENNWNTIRSAYFADPNSGKLREIDIVSRWHFEKKIYKNHELKLNITLLIECKSLSNYHILTDGAVAEYSCGNDNVWFGYDSYNRNVRLLNILNKSSLPPNEKAAIIDLLNKWCFPGDASLFIDHRPQPFNDISCYSSFRETNLGTTKELDSSVIWKSCLALTGAAVGYENSVWHSIESDLLSTIDYISTYKVNYKRALKSLFYPYQLLNYASLHKVLVVDSFIWEAAGTIKQLPYFRLIQKTIQGYTDSWVDIVHIDSFSDYLEKISKHYLTTLTATGMMQKK
ncbi:MAG: hypothetical protein V4649_11100 [Bacteroidota bacterium]